MQTRKHFLATREGLSIHLNRVNDMQVGHELMACYEVSPSICGYELEPFPLPLSSDDHDELQSLENESAELLELIMDNCRSELRDAAESVIESEVEFQAEYEREHEDSGSEYCSIVEGYRFSEPSVVESAADKLGISSEHAATVLEHCDGCYLEPRPSGIYDAGWTDAVVVDSFILGDLEVDLAAGVFDSYGSKRDEVLSALDFLGVEHKNGHVYGCNEGYTWDCVLELDYLRDVLSELINSSDIMSESGELCEEVAESNGKLVAVTADDNLVCSECCDESINQSEFNLAGFDESDSRITHYYDATEFLADDDCKCSLCGSSVMTSNVERLTGGDAGIVRMRTDNLHLSMSVLSAVREVALPIIRRMRGNPEFTRELKRGLILEVMLRHSANLETYAMATRGSI